MGLIERLCGRVRELDFGKKPEEETDLTFIEKAEDALTNYRALYEPFHGSYIIPANRTELYALYGRAPKETKYVHPKCKMTTVKNLPGTWNKGSGKLHVAAYVEPYLKEAFRRIELLDQFKDIKRIGSYSHRHIRHDETMPLSYHSWGAAIDIDPGRNSSKYRSSVWDKKKKRGPVPPPFSKEWQELWPDGVSYGVVMIMEACGFTWGGDWGGSFGWRSAVGERGVGYSLEGYGAPWRDWHKVSYIDPMHFQLVGR